MMALILEYLNLPVSVGTQPPGLNHSESGRVRLRLSRACSDSASRPSHSGRVWSQDRDERPGPGSRRPGRASAAAESLIGGQAALPGRDGHGQDSRN